VPPGRGVGSADRPLPVLRVPAVLDGGVVAQGQPRAARLAAHLLAARVGPARVPQALLRDELRAVFPEHGGGGGGDHRDRGGRRGDRRLQADSLRVPPPDPGGPGDAAGLHVPAHHHAGAAVPARPGAGSRQLAPGPRADLHLVLAALRALDPARLLPIEREPAALLDGANRAQALWYVVMPLALPGIIATAIFTFIVAWNDFLFALVLIGQDELKTLAIGINEFFHMAVVDWGLIMAAGVMVTIPALVFFVAVQRYLIAGWGAGGLKG